MKLELFERDQQGHEVRTARRKLEPSQELSLEGACAIRVVRTDQLPGLTLQIVSLGPSTQRAPPPPLNLSALPLLRTRVACVLGASEEQVNRLSDPEIRVLAVLIACAGQPLSHHRLAIQLGGMFRQLSDEDVDNMVRALERTLSDSGLHGLMQRHDNGDISLRI